MLINAEEITIPRRKFRAIINNPEKSAEAVNLIYVNDATHGIRRLRKGNSFVYTFKNKNINDASSIERIRKLVIPPAWEDVWICKFPNGHLQATGLDLKKRKQYKYHVLWNALRNHTKFYRLHQFGKALPVIREALEKDLSKPGLPQEKVLAAVLCLMELTNIRVGNNLYEKLYGSFGLTTLKDKHVKINGHAIRFMFRGKKGISHNISIKSKRLAKIVSQCKDIPGKELFQYYDDTGNRRGIDSGMVNDYIKCISGRDFTAKDFRTWAGTVQALMAFKTLGSCDKITEAKRRIVTALDYVADKLGNTRSVCKKYYVHPVILSLYENNSLEKYFLQLQNFEKLHHYDLEYEEKLLMRILEKESLTVKI
jgi:DNA topoisomerase-1